MKQTKLSNSVTETLNFTEEIGKNAKSGDIYALYGDLGSGKTIIAKGIAKGIGIMDDITSPTFNLLETYEGDINLYHFDLYRIESERELDQLFFEEYWEGDGISVIEWAENAGARLPDSIIKIFIEYIDENKRRIKIEYPGN